jgi:hypothetical protein
VGAENGRIGGRGLRFNSMITRDGLPNSPYFLADDDLIPSSLVYVIMLEIILVRVVIWGPGRRMEGNAGQDFSLQRSTV